MYLYQITFEPTEKQSMYEHFKMFPAVNGIHLYYVFLSMTKAIFNNHNVIQHVY